MSTWMKRVFSAEGVTEFPVGPHLAKLADRFGQSGAVMLLIDVSASMGAGSQMQQAIEGCKGFIDDAVGGSYEVGLLLWNTRVEACVPPSTGGGAARRLLGKARPTGGTNISPALERAGEMLLQADVGDRVIAVFGDGDLGDARQAQLVSSRLAAQGIRILTLGLGEESARHLGAISTEEADAPRSASTNTMSEDIRGLARGLKGRRR